MHGKASRKSLGAKGGTEQKPLCLIAVMPSEDLQLLEGLHPFGDHLEVQIARQPDHRGNDAHGAAVVLEVGDERLIDFDAVDRELREGSSEGDE